MAKGYPFGFARAMLWTYVQSGTYIGMCSGQQNTLTPGTASGAYVWDDVKSAAVQQLADTALQIQGGDQIRATIIFPGGKLQDFDITGSSIDTVMNDLIGGSSTNTTNTGVTVTSNNPSRMSPKTLGIGLQQGFQLDSGAIYYVTRVIPRAQVTIRPGGMNFRGESDSVMHISSIKTNRAYNGQLFGTGGLALNLTNDRADYIDYITPNAFHIMAFRQDDSDVEFNTTYKPLSTVVTLNATENPFTVGGTPAALSSLTLAGVATLAAAGTTDIYDVLSYATEFVPV